MCLKLSGPARGPHDRDEGDGLIKRSIAFMAVIALGAGALAAPAAGQTAAPADCPQPVPASEVQRGLRGTGYTVVSGREPEPFSVEVLGVLNDALGPGRDMIVADVTSPAIEEAGGIWAGMSGSPVYVDTRLLGAVAYGLSEDDSTIAGITPAQDMLDLLSYPSRLAAPEPAPSQRTIALTPTLRKRIADGGSSSGDGTLRALRVPLSISGGRGSQLVRPAIRREGLPYIAYNGSSASSDVAATAANLQPGDSFAGTFSYGDITVAEIGTTAIVCNNMAIAFGHSIYPFFPQGYTEMGANEAEVLTIVDNPNFKLATVEELVGTVDQDRLAGVRALLNVIPTTVPVRSTITAEDLNRTLTGETNVVVQKMVPTIANVHMVDSVDSAFDQVGSGSLEATWTITGTRESGATWQLTRSNMYASHEDIARDSFNELTGNLFALFYNGHEDIKFTEVEARATVREALHSYDIVQISVSVNDGEFKQGRRVRVKPRDGLVVRTTLQPSESVGEAGDVQVFEVDLELKVPRTATGQGYIRVTGGSRGGGFRSCFYDGEYCARRIASRYDSFDDLLASLAKKRGNNSVAARLYLGRRRTQVVSRDRETMDRVVIGDGYMQVTMPDGSGDGREVPIGHRTERG